MFSSSVDWEGLANLVDRVSKPGTGIGSILDVELGLIEDSISTIRSEQDWPAMIRLREMLGFLVKGETTGGMDLVQRINEAAIEAAEVLGDQRSLARYLHDSGENYHRQGYHRMSIEAFERSAALYREEGEDFRALESYYFSSLPYRALGETERARDILTETLHQLSPTDPWRANPLQVLSWMSRDEGRFSDAEALLHEALELYGQYEGPDSIHVVQTLADLGEVIGLQGRFAEAASMFEQSLKTVERFGGQYDRQEARTKMKYAEMLIRQRVYDRALRLLDEADDIIRGYGHYYDLMWRIELARALAFWGKRLWGNALLKARAVLRYRREIGLPNSDFVHQFRRRSRWGTGLPS